MSRADRPVEVLRLEGLFRHIEQTRMVGVPILNPALRVQAVGFRPWNGYQLGVLITPWFMNLILLGDGADGRLAERRAGEKISHAFPSGLYEFIVAEEPALAHNQPPGVGVQPVECQVSESKQLNPRCRSQTSHRRAISPPNGAWFDSDTSDEGRYQACSLFSPMQPFDSQELAVATAGEILRGVMREENRSEVSTHSSEIVEAWGGGAKPVVEGRDSPVALTGHEPTLSERLETPLTRRELFTGLS